MNLKEFLESKIKTIRYLFEAIAVKFGLWVFYVMEPKKASDIAAKISRFVGKKLPVHQLAYRNLSKAIPNLSENEKEKILDDMWDNLGRIVGEYSHISKYSPDQIGNITECSAETLDNINWIKNNGKGGIIFSGHIGNWEVGPKVFAKLGIDTNAVYRPLNNPYVEKMTASIRGGKLITKSIQGNRKIIEVLKNGGFVVIMADQKISEGEPVKFFHDYAITATAIARIALKYSVPLIPARSIRVGKDFKFIVEIEKPLEIQTSKDINYDVLQLTTKINAKLESWIRQYPAQWFWVHNRWKK